MATVYNTCWSHSYQLPAPPSRLPPLNGTSFDLKTIDWPRVRLVLDHLETFGETPQRSNLELESGVVENDVITKLCLCGQTHECPTEDEDTPNLRKIPPFPMWIKTEEEWESSGLLESWLASRLYGHHVLMINRTRTTPHSDDSASLSFLWRLYPKPCPGRSWASQRIQRDQRERGWLKKRPLELENENNAKYVDLMGDDISEDTDGVPDNVIFVNGIESQTTKWTKYRGCMSPFGVDLFHSGSPNFEKARRYYHLYLETDEVLPPVYVGLRGESFSMSDCERANLQRIEGQRWVVQDGAHRLMARMLSGSNLEVLVKVKHREHDAQDER